MPIPLPNNGSPARTGGIPNVPLVNGGGRGVSVENLAGLIDVPQLDIRGEQAYAQGAEAFGKGVGAVGGALGKMAEVQFKAINIKRVADFEAEANLTKNKIAAAWANEPDELKWKDITARGIADFKNNKSIFRDDNSPDVVDHIQARMVGFEKGLEGETILSSANESIKKAAKVVQSNYDSAILNLDQQGANRSVQQLVDSGKITFEEGNLAKQKAAQGIAYEARRQEGQAQQATYEEMQRQIRLNPAIELPEGLNVTEAQRHALENRKQETVRERAVDTGNALSEEVYARMNEEDPAKRLANEGMVEDIARQIPGATEKQIHNAKVLYHKLDSIDHRQWVEDMGPVNMSKARQYVQAYHPEQDKDRSKYDELKSWIVASVPRANQKDAMALLTAKVKPGSAIPKTDPVLKTIQQRLDQVKNQGLFGPFLSDKNKIDPATKGPVIKNGRPVKEVDMEKLAGVQDKVAALEGHMRKWMQDNPELAKSATKAIQELNGQMPRAVMAGALQAAYQQFTGKSIAPQSQSMDDADAPAEPEPEPPALEQPPDLTPEPEPKKPKPKGSADVMRPELPGNAYASPPDGSLLPDAPEFLQ